MFFFSQRQNDVHQEKSSGIWQLKPEERPIAGKLTRDHRLHRWWFPPKHGGWASHPLGFPNFHWSKIQPLTELHTLCFPKACNFWSWELLPWEVYGLLPLCSRVTRCHKSLFQDSFGSPKCWFGHIAAYWIFCVFVKHSKKDSILRHRRLCAFWVSLCFLNTICSLCGIIAGWISAHGSWKGWKPRRRKVLWKPSGSPIYNIIYIQLYIYTYVYIIDVHTYIHTYLPTYLHTYIHTYV